MYNDSVGLRAAIEDREPLAAALRTLESRLGDFVDALAHASGPLVLEHARSEREARRLACEAYATIDYGMEDAPNATVTCLGVIAGTREIVAAARAVNAAKLAFKTVATPLSRRQVRVPAPTGEGTTEKITVLRAALRSLQRSDLNLLAAYRKIPILANRPSAIGYTRTLTRGVYRKTVEQVGDLLAQLEGPDAIADRSRLRALPRRERHLALVRDHYANVRANVSLAVLDSRGRGRLQLAAELPILYVAPRGAPFPEVRFPATDSGDGVPRVRRGIVEAEPFLVSVPVHRYKAHG